MTTSANASSFQESMNYWMLLSLKRFFGTLHFLEVLANVVFLVKRLTWRILFLHIFNIYMHFVTILVLGVLFEGFYEVEASQDSEVFQESIVQHLLCFSGRLYILSSSLKSSQDSLKLKSIVFAMHFLVCLSARLGSSGWSSSQNLQFLSPQYFNFVSTLFQLATRK